MKRAALDRLERHALLVGIGVGVAVLIGIKALNGRKRKKELKELQRLLSERR